MMLPLGPGVQEQVRGWHPGETRGETGGDSGGLHNADNRPLVHPSCTWTPLLSYQAQHSNPSPWKQHGEGPATWG